MFHVEIDMPSWCRSQFSQEVNDAWLKCVAGLINKVRYVTYFQEFAANQRATRRYNSKEIPREMHEDHLELRRVVMHAQHGKLQPN